MYRTLYWAKLDVKVKGQYNAKLYQTKVHKKFPFIY